MKLIKCYIENFGLLHTAEFNFSKGLNCCISENGTGKSTLAAFIEAMLYGIGDTRRQSLDENPRKKYYPWQGGRFGGSLTVEVGKKRYVIERSFGARPADDTFRLLDADSGNESRDFGDDVGERLFGIDRDGFLRTVFLSEKNIQGKNDNKSISAKLSDLVGVDGDVGGFDEALKLLEDRRKFYFKKGNTGEIANVKERINECQRRLDNVTRLEGEARQIAETQRAISDERAKLTELEKEQRAKLASIGKLRERSANEERYANMLREVSIEKANLAKSTEFFAQGIPSAVEIDGARDAYNEAKRLRDEALSESGNEECVILGEFFKSGTDFAEISEMERCAELREEKERELKAIEGEYDAASKRMKELFKTNAPKKEEAERMQRMANSSSGFKKSILVLIGLAIAVTGIIISGGIGYTIAGVGAVVAILSAILVKSNAKSKELLAFIAEYGNEECSCTKKTLDTVMASIDEYESLGKEREERRELLGEENSALTLKVCAFLGRFPLVDADSMLDSVRIIKHKYTKFYALSQVGEASKSGKLEKLKRSESLLKTAEEFLAKYPTVTSNPFQEIRDRLNEHTYLSASLARIERECDVFAVKYGVTGKTVSAEADTEAAVTAALREISDRVKALSAKEAVAERELNIMRAEIEKRDEYLMLKEELEELLAKHTDSLDVIKKTSAYLKAACDNITSKYLGKTKEKFEEYSRLIAGADGEYTLNTSFELSKTERGESHGIESYSRGTRDLYALGLRLALVDALYEKESPFIILDDPFVALDDAKLARAKETLKAIGKTKQILYFTCAKSRAIE